jgi:D-amino-acid dehydrogenase
MKVIIIGGGMLGSSTAYHLVRQGAAVTVFDRADDGRATAAGAGIVSPWLTDRPDPAYYAIASAAARYYPRLVADLEGDGESDLGYRRVGSIVVPEDPAELDDTEDRLLARRAEAPEIGTVRRLTSEQAVLLFPPLRRDRPALHIEGTARVDGRRMAAAMLRAVQTRGGVVQAGSPDLAVANGRVVGVRLGGRLIEADAVVVAAGAWAPDVLAPLGIHLAVAPQKGQIVHLRLRGAQTSAWPVVQPMNSYYLLAFDDSRVVAGATREFNSGFDYRVTAGGLAEVLEFGLTFAPGLATAELMETRIGFRPMAMDNLPLLGPVTDIQGLMIGNGLGPSGLTIGPYAGRLLADATLGRATELDLAPYAPLRPTLVRP